MFSGTLIIGARIVKPSWRIMIMALGRLTMSLASIAGPLLGGILTSKLDWNWCFLINLPIAGLTFLSVWLVLPSLVPTSMSPRRTWTGMLRSFDLLGALLLLGAAVMLFLALHYAADGFSWSSPRVLLLLVSAGATWSILVFWMRHAGERAIIQSWLMAHRTVAAAGLLAVGLCGALAVLVYYLPVYFQAVRAMSAKQSGVALLPYLVTMALSGVGSAWLTTRTCLPQRIAVAVFALDLTSFVLLFIFSICFLC